MKSDVLLKFKFPLGYWLFAARNWISLLAVELDPCEDRFVAEARKEFV